MIENEMFARAETQYRLTRAVQGLAESRRRRAERRARRWQGPLRGAGEMR